MGESEEQQLNMEKEVDVLHLCECLFLLEILLHVYERLAHQITHTIEHVAFG